MKRYYSNDNDYNNNTSINSHNNYNNNNSNKNYNNNNNLNNNINYNNNYKTSTNSYSNTSFNNNNSNYNRDFNNSINNINPHNNNNKFNNNNNISRNNQIGNDNDNNNNSKYDIKPKYVPFTSEEALHLNLKTMETIFEKLNLSNSNQCLLVLSGIPGSGKSTYAKYFLESVDPLSTISWVCFNQDLMKTRKKVVIATRKALLEGKSVIIDTCHFNYDDRKYCVNLIKELESEAGNQRNITSICLVMPHANDVPYCVQKATTRGTDEAHPNPSNWNSICKQISSIYKIPNLSENFDNYYYCQSEYCLYGIITCFLSVWYYPDQISGPYNPKINTKSIPITSTSTSNHQPTKKQRITSTETIIAPVLKNTYSKEVLSTVVKNTSVQIKSFASILPNITTTPITAPAVMIPVDTTTTTTTTSTTKPVKVKKVKPMTLDEKINKANEILMNYNIESLSVSSALKQYTLQTGSIVIEEIKPIGITPNLIWESKITCILKEGQEGISGVATSAAKKTAYQLAAIIIVEQLKKNIQNNKTTETSESTEKNEENKTTDE